MLARLEDVHALATASLVASTQRDIVEQLAQHDPSTTVAGIPSITDTKSADTETSDNCRTKEEKTSRKKANKKGLYRSFMDFLNYYYIFFSQSKGSCCYVGLILVTRSGQCKFFVW